MASCRVGQPLTACRFLDPTPALAQHPGPPDCRARKPTVLHRVPSDCCLTHSLLQVEEKQYCLADVNTLPLGTGTVY